ncbi:hypothetical protein SELMODRAFT_445132 [Selaginella moellendorffii]|uniref:Uncharacterized protein n=1 Tax=Selaginella moellendorffii TaxID=88036 RepID=D8SG04_SELML|nr:hypothetical protein SELMODRAFT_445132 [Selaginella moellendorffii]
MALASDGTNVPALFELMLVDQGKHKVHSLSIAMWNEDTIDLKHEPAKATPSPAKAWKFVTCEDSLNVFVDGDCMEVFFFLSGLEIRAFPLGVSNYLNNDNLDIHVHDDLFSPATGTGRW